MPNRIPAVVAVALVLAVAGGAQAKGPISGLTVCGSNGCVSVTKGAGMDKVFPLVESPASGVAVGPAKPAPFYRVRLGLSDDPYSPEPVYYVPAAGVVRVKNPALAEWLSVPPEGRALLQEITASLEPYRVPRLSTVFVNELLAKGPASYLRLFSVGTTVHRTAGAGGWFSMLLLSKRPSPWGDGANDLWVSRHGSLLKRDGQVVQVPAGLAERIRHRVPL